MNVEQGKVEPVTPMTEDQLPVCPHCLATPQKFSTVPLRFKAARCQIIFCGNPKCRKTIAVQITEMLPAENAPRIHTV